MWAWARVLCYLNAHSILLNMFILSFFWLKKRSVMKNGEEIITDSRNRPREGERGSDSSTFFTQWHILLQSVVWYGGGGGGAVWSKLFILINSALGSYGTVYNLWCWWFLAERIYERWSYIFDRVLGAVVHHHKMKREKTIMKNKKWVCYNFGVYVVGNGRKEANEGDDVNDFGWRESLTIDILSPAIWLHDIQFWYLFSSTCQDYIEEWLV